MTPEEVKKIIQENEVSFVPNHDCSLCGVTVGYHINDIEQELIWFRSACGCGVGGEGGHWSSFSDIADWYNMQDNDKGRNSVLEKIRGRK